MQVAQHSSSAVIVITAVTATPKSIAARVARAGGDKSAIYRGATIFAATAYDLADIATTTIRARRTRAKAIATQTIDLADVADYNFFGKSATEGWEVPTDTDWRSLAATSTKNIEGADEGVSFALGASLEPMMATLGKAGYYHVSVADTGRGGNQVDHYVVTRGAEGVAVELQ